MNSFCRIDVTRVNEIFGKRRFCWPLCSCIFSSALTRIVLDILFLIWKSPPPTRQIKTQIAVDTKAQMCRPTLKNPMVSKQENQQRVQYKKSQIKSLIYEWTVIPFTSSDSSWRALQFFFWICFDLTERSSWKSLNVSVATNAISWRIAVFEEFKVETSNGSSCYQKNFDRSAQHLSIDMLINELHMETNQIFRRDRRFHSQFSDYEIYFKFMLHVISYWIFQLRPFVFNIFLNT